MSPHEFTIEASSGQGTAAWGTSQQNQPQASAHLEERVVWQVLEGELALARVAGVRLAEDGVAVPRDHVTRRERVPAVLGQLLRAGVLPEVPGEVFEPPEHLLVREAAGARDAGSFVSARRVKPLQTNRPQVSESVRGGCG